MKTVCSKDGTLVAYWRSGSGTPLLLVHGATDDHLLWTSVLSPLHQQCSVYAMDRRGRGHSGDSDVYALQREWEDIAAVIDAIGSAVDVVGHSLGGTCALEAALLTANVRRLILYEPAMPLGRTSWSGESSSRMRSLLVAGDRAQALLLFLRDILKTPPEMIASAQASPTWPARVASVHTLPRELQSLNSYLFDPKRFGAMQIPTLLLLGGDSPPFRRTDAETLHAALPNSRIAVLPGQRHRAMETAPDLFVQEVLTFLAEPALSAG
jgi:pimeloyl-ACP methyl ester carboxylesterase